MAAPPVSNAATDPARQPSDAADGRAPDLPISHATSDLATSDLATSDLATPDLATPDLATPDLATSDLATKYDPTAVEAATYQRWLDLGVFTAHPDSDRPTFTIVIPPPNVTGSLHLGHAFQHTLMDALIRRKRMQGYDALWLPGMDHAGIATQNVVERELRKAGVTRHDLGREAFVAK